MFATNAEALPEPKVEVLTKAALILYGKLIWTLGVSSPVKSASKAVLCCFSTAELSIGGWPANTFVHRIHTKDNALRIRFITAPYLGEYIEQDSTMAPPPVIAVVITGVVP